jgi:hypothetical protein
MTVGPFSRFGNPAPPRLSAVTLGSSTGGGGSVTNQSGDGYNPALNGLLLAACDPEMLNSQTTLTAGVPQLFALPVTSAVTVANFVYNVATAGSTLTAGQNFVGIYGNRSTNTINLLGLSADQSTNYGTANNRIAALTVQGGQSLTLPAGSTVWAAFLFNGTTSPTLQRIGSQAISGNINLAAPNLRSMVIGTGATTLPPTLDLSTATVASPLWVGLS